MFHEHFSTVLITLILFESGYLKKHLLIRLKLFFCSHQFVWLVLAAIQGYLLWTNTFIPPYRTQTPYNLNHIIDEFKSFPTYTIFPDQYSLPLAWPTIVDHVVASKSIFSTKKDTSIISFPLQLDAVLPRVVHQSYLKQVPVASHFKRFRLSLLWETHITFVIKTL